MYCKEIKLTFNEEYYDSQKVIFDYNDLYKEANNIKFNPKNKNDYYNQLMQLLVKKNSDEAVGVYEMEAYSPKKAINCGIIPIDCYSSGYSNYGLVGEGLIRTKTSCVMAGKVYEYNGHIPSICQTGFFVVEGTKEERQCKLEHYQALEHKVLDKNAIFYKNKSLFVEIMGKKIYSSIDRIIKRREAKKAGK